MIRKSLILTFAILAIILVLVSPAPAMFAGQGQVSSGSLAEELVRLAENAEQQVKNLIDIVYANETAIEKITDLELFDSLEGNVSFYNQGATTLTKAQTALGLLDYERAIGNVTEALRIFREVFRSIHIILEDADLQTGNIVDAYGLLEAYSRALERIEQLRALLPEEATESRALLDQAEALLDLDVARALLLEGNVTETTSHLAQANQLISEVYQCMKQQAEASNNFRVNGYLQEMEQARERIHERFRYAGDQGVNVGTILASFGYHNETEFIHALENMTQTAQGKIGDIDSVIQDLEAIGQLIRQMNQTLTQEINRHQEQHGNGGGTGGSGSGSGSDGSWSGAGTSGSGSDTGSEGSGPGGSGASSGDSKGASSGAGGSGSRVTGSGVRSDGGGSGSGSGSGAK